MTTAVINDWSYAAIVVAMHVHVRPQAAAVIVSDVIVGLESAPSSHDLAS